VKQRNSETAVLKKRVKQRNSDFRQNFELWLTFIDIQLVSLYIFSKDVNVGHEMEKASPLTLKVDLFGEKTAQFGVLDRDEHYQQEPENQRVRR
jgi:hypothetical protein